MSSHSLATRLMFDKKKQNMKVKEAPAEERQASKDDKSAKGHSQDADRHAKVTHLKSGK